MSEQISIRGLHGSPKIHDNAKETKHSLLKLNSASQFLREPDEMRGAHRTGRCPGLDPSASGSWFRTS